MALVTIKGAFLGAQIRKKSYEGNKESYVQIDIYQSGSTAANKTVTIKADDVEVYDILKQYDLGSYIELECLVNAFKNQTYFKLVRIIDNII